MNAMTEAIKDMVFEAEAGLAVVTDCGTGPLAPSGEPFDQVVRGRYTDGVITDADLIGRMRLALRRLRRLNPMAKAIYWRRRPEFQEDFCNGRLTKLCCSVAFSDKGPGQ